MNNTIQTFKKILCQKYSNVSKVLHVHFNVFINPAPISFIITYKTSIFAENFKIM